MRLYSILNALITRTTPATLSELKYGSSDSIKTITPAIFKDAIEYYTNAPVIVRTWTSPSTAFSSGNTWVYSKDWHPDDVDDYTAIGVLQGTPNSGGAGLITQLAISYQTYGDRFLGMVNNTTSSSITATLAIPVLYIRNDLIES